MISELEVKSNIDEELEKAKELVSLLERANELIQSLGNSKLEVKLNGAVITENIKGVSAPNSILNQTIEGVL